MANIAVRFIEVGRDKKTFTADVAAQHGMPTYNGMVLAIRKRHALLSRDIEFGDGGEIYAGIRVVGRFEYDEPAEATP